MKLLDFTYQYAFNLALTFDQAVNVILLGDPDDSISGRCGRALLSGKPKWWVKPLSMHVDWMFDFIFNEKNHCLNSVEEGEKYEKELWCWHD